MTTTITAADIGDDGWLIADDIDVSDPSMVTLLDSLYELGEALERTTTSMVTLLDSLYELGEALERTTTAITALVGRRNHIAQCAECDGLGIHTYHHPDGTAEPHTCWTCGGLGIVPAPPSRP